MQNRETLWEGSISLEHIKSLRFIAITGFLCFAIVELVVILFILEAHELMMIIILSILIGAVGMGVFASLMMWIPIILKWFPKYIVTSDEIISVERGTLGRRKEMKIKLKDVKTLYFLHKDPNESDSFFFHKKSVDEILGGNPLVDPVYDSFAGGDFILKWVDSSLKLLKVLETIIPLQKHPTLKDIYQKVES